MEDELGVLLFDRLPSGVTPTRSGKVLLELAETTLASALALANAAARLRGEVGGTVRLGTIIDPDSLQLGDFLARMLRYHPMIEVKLKHGISGEILRQVEPDELDAGYYLGDVETPGTSTRELRKVSYVIIAPPTWAISDKDLSHFAMMPWVGTHVHSSQHRIVNSLFAGAGLSAPAKAIEVDQESSMISLVRSGVGLCLMRSEIALPAAERGEVCVWEGAIPPCRLSFIYSDKQSESASIAAMLHVLDGMDWA